jgi:hypothetical protein
MCRLMETDSTLSVTELAELVSRSSDPEEIAKVKRRLRHLTTIGALPTTGDVHPGQGRAREYDEESTAAAAVLVRLGDIGLTVNTLLRAAAAIRLSMAVQKTRWEGAVLGEPTYLGLWLGQNVVLRSWFLCGPGEVDKHMAQSPDNTGLIILELHHIFK